MMILETRGWSWNAGHVVIGYTHERGSLMGSIIMNSKQNKALIAFYCENNEIDPESVQRIEISGDGIKGEDIAIFYILDEDEFGFPFLRSERVDL